MAKKNVRFFPLIHLSHGEITSNLNRHYQEIQVRKSICRWGEKYYRDVSVDRMQSLN